MFNVSVETDAAEQLVAMLKQRIGEFASRRMSEEFREWEAIDVNRSDPEAAQTSTHVVETTMRERPRGAAGWLWWEDQPREPSGTPEGGEWMPFPSGHWRRRRRRGRGRRGQRPSRQRQQKGVIQSVLERRLRRRVRRAVMPRHLRRLRRRVMPRPRAVKRRLRRLAGVPTMRGLRRRLGIRPRPILRPQLGERLANRMLGSMTRTIKWR